MLYTADFETTTDINDCRVWAWGTCQIGNDYKFEYGNDIDSFMKKCANPLSNDTYYFHNLKFDGEFIIYWLFRNGFTHDEGKERTKKSRTFRTLISDKNQFYSIEIIFSKKGKKTNKVTIYDSLKKLNFKVSEIAKMFKMDIEKLNIGQFNILSSGYRGISKVDFGKKYNGEITRIALGYKGYRPIGHILTKEEIAYLKNDVEIPARGLQALFDNGMKKMTIGSDALNEYKQTIGERKFNLAFPKLDVVYDSYIRQSYKGGWTYLNEKYKNKEVGLGVVLDVNSLYPSVMYYDYLPHGIGVKFTGEYKDDPLYPLYVTRFRCQFELKDNYLPTIQIKGDLDFKSTEYLKSSRTRLGVLKEVEMTLTNVDFELFMEHYEVYNIEYIDGYKFKATNGLFREYIDHWINVKNTSKNEGNAGMYLIAKLMLNSLYGKFALNPKVKSKFPIYDKHNDKLSYYEGEEEIRDGIYLPMGTFITAYARNKTIRACQKEYDRFIYADTDSAHLEGEELPDSFDIDPNKLGAWDYEFKFSKGKYLRAKCYMEHGKNPYKDEKEYTKITCAGMPEKCYAGVTFDNFKVGGKFSGKLQPKKVSGGIVLVDGDFTIKENIFY